jgi:hypothetical protein
VYAAFGGLYGDCGAYQGSVVSAPLTGDGPLARWLTPTSREGAIWGTGGPVTGPDGDLWVAIGNGAAESGAYDGSDSVTELTPALRRVAYFAPATWPVDNADDLDLGSTQPVLAAGNAVFVMGKRGEGYLLSAAPAAAARCTSSTRRRARPSTRSRSATGCRTSRRCPWAAVPPT